MVWFFERSGEQLRCEIRPAEDAHVFELVWTLPDGRIEVERSDDPAQLTERRRIQEQRLRLDAWTTIGGGAPLPDEKRFL